VPDMRPVGPYNGAQVGFAEITPKFGPHRPVFGPTEGQGRPSLTPVGFGWAKAIPNLHNLHLMWARLRIAICTELVAVLKATGKCSKVGIP
jgi:hypothetical protein